MNLRLDLKSHPKLLIALGASLVLAAVLASFPALTFASSDEEEDCEYYAQIKNITLKEDFDSENRWDTSSEIRLVLANASVSGSSQQGYGFFSTDFEAEGVAHVDERQMNQSQSVQMPYLHVLPGKNESFYFTVSAFDSDLTSQSRMILKKEVSASKLRYQDCYMPSGKYDSHFCTQFSVQNSALKVQVQVNRHCGGWN